MWLKFRLWISSVLVALIYGLYSRTWRVKHLKLNGESYKEKEPTVYAHWHGDELLLIGACAFQNHAVMVSRSRDGELLQRVLSWFGYHVVRGSSSKGGAGGLKGLVDAVTKNGLSASLAVDGPRGPRHEVKVGILKLAQTTGRPLVAGAVAVSRSYVFHKAWNKCFLPWPFARAVVLYSEPIHVPRDVTLEKLESLRLELEQALLHLKTRAEFQMKHLSATRNSVSSLVNR